MNLQPRAYEVSVKTWDPPRVGIYAATKPAKARYQAWRSAQEAGYDMIKFDDLRVVRAPEFDCIVPRLKHGVAREFAALLRQEHKP